MKKTSIGDIVIVHHIYLEAAMPAIVLKVINDECLDVNVFQAMPLCNNNGKSGTITFLNISKKKDGMLDSVWYETKEEYENRNT